MLLTLSLTNLAIVRRVMFNKCAVFCGVMVRVLDLRPGHSGFESRSVLTLILCCFLKDKFYFSNKILTLNQ